jgi:hypothetical protein
MKFADLCLFQPTLVVPDTELLLTHNLTGFRNEQIEQ